MISYKTFFIRYSEYLESPRAKSYFSLALTLITIIAMILIVQPALSYVSILKKNVNDAREIDKLLRLKIDNLQKAKANYNSISGDLFLFDLALPNSPDLTTYISYAENTAAASGVSLDSFQLSSLPLTPTETSTRETLSLLTIKPMSYTARATGSYENIKAFIRALENFLRTTDIVSANFTKGQTEESITVNLELKAYFLGVSKK